MNFMRLWFKAKQYGYGWYPVTWEGWLIITGYIVAAILLFIKYDRRSHSASDTLINFIPAFLLLTAALIVVCVKKGEKARWRWGGKE